MTFPSTRPRPLPPSLHKHGCDRLLAAQACDVMSRSPDKDSSVVRNRDFTHHHHTSRVPFDGGVGPASGALIGYAGWFYFRSLALTVAADAASPALQRHLVPHHLLALAMAMILFLRPPGCNLYYPALIALNLACPRYTISQSLHCTRRKRSRPAEGTGLSHDGPSTNGSVWWRSSQR